MFASTTSTARHTWTAAQLAALADYTGSDYDLCRYMRHRFGGSLAAVTDRAIRNRRYVLTHAEGRAEYSSRRRASLSDRGQMLAAAVACSM